MVHVFVDERRAELFVSLEANLELIARRRLSYTPSSLYGTLLATIPHGIIDQVGALLLVIRVDEPRSPEKLGISEDSRELGIGIRRITLKCDAGCPIADVTAG